MTQFFHQSVTAIEPVHTEAIEHYGGGDNYADNDTHNCIDAQHGKGYDKDKVYEQPANEDEQVLCRQSLELYGAVYAMVYSVFHTI